MTFLLGAGTSRSAGIPLGSELATLFEEHILIHRKGANILKDDDLALYEKYLKNPAAHKEAWMKIKGKYVGSEYFDLAEQCFATATDRNRFFCSIVEKAVPQNGHKTLAQLAMKFPTTFDLAMTTNFDDLIARAFPDMFNTTSSATATVPPGCKPRSAFQFTSEVVDDNFNRLTLESRLKKMKDSFAVWHVHGAAHLAALGAPLNSWAEVCFTSRMCRDTDGVFPCAHTHLLFHFSNN